MNEAIFNLCASTNGMYFISHNTFAFNDDLNKILFWKIEKRKQERVMSTSN